MITVKDQVSMMWGKEVADTLDAEGLLAGSLDPTRFSVMPHTHYEVQFVMPYSVIMVNTPLIVPRPSDGIDRMAREFMYEWRNFLGYPAYRRTDGSTPPRGFSKVWPKESKAQATKVRNALDKWAHDMGAKAKMFEVHFVKTREVV
jgi:hypothetical protein